MMFESENLMKKYSSKSKVKMVLPSRKQPELCYLCIGSYVFHLKQILGHFFRSVQGVRTWGMIFFDQILKNSQCSLFFLNIITLSYVLKNNVSEKFRP